MGREVTLDFELTRSERCYVSITLDEEDLEDYEEMGDIDPWDYTDRAWDRANDYGDWETYDDDTQSARIDYDSSVWDDEEEEDEDERDEDRPRQPMPARDVLVGRLVIDGDASVYEVESVSADGYLVLLDVDTGQQTDDYGGRQAWKRGLAPGFYRWYRSGEHVIVHDGSHQTVVDVSGGTVTLLNGQVYEWTQTYDWTWEEEEVEDEATA